MSVVRSGRGKGKYLAMTPLITSFVEKAAAEAAQRIQRWYRHRKVADRFKILAAKRLLEKKSIPMDIDKNYGRGYGGSSVLSGKLKKGIKASVEKRKKLAKLSSDGINSTTEASKETSATDMKIIGHTSYPRKFVYYNAVRAIFFKMAKMMGVPPATCQDALEITAGTVIDVLYKLTPNTAIASVGFNVPAAPATVSIDDLADWWTSQLRPWAATQYEVQFQAINVGRDRNQPLRLNLTTALIHYTVKSSMKFQNRSQGLITGETGDENAVDNVPLYGKSYSGNGTGMKLKMVTNDGNNLYGDENYGIIDTAWPANRSEPPQVNQFTNVKYCNKVGINPGEIKTSVLQMVESQYIDSIHRQACDYGPSFNPTNLVIPRAKNKGSYRVFYLEKVLGNIGSAPIVLAYENNIEGSFKVVMKPKLTTLKNFNKVTLV